MRTAHARLSGGHRVDAFDEIGIERRRQPDRLREARALACGVTVQALLMEDHRNAQPAVSMKNRWIALVSSASGGP